MAASALSCVMLVCSIAWTQEAFADLPVYEPQGYETAILQEMVSLDVPSGWGNNASDRPFTCYSPVNDSGAFSPDAGTLMTTYFPKEMDDTEQMLDQYAQNIEDMNSTSSLRSQKEMAGGCSARRITYQTQIGANVYNCEVVCFGIGDTVYAVEMKQGTESSYDYFPLFGHVVDSIDVKESETQAPETQAPETQAPETQAPETQAPETQAPETQAPETQPALPFQPVSPESEAPETQAPETQAPETQPEGGLSGVIGQPETQAPETQPEGELGGVISQPETQPPETQAPETQAPETQPPETQAPETQAPETQAPETQAPETQAPEPQPKMESRDLGTFQYMLNGSVHEFPTALQNMDQSDLPIDFGKLLPFDIVQMQNPGENRVALLNTQYYDVENAFYREIVGISNISGRDTVIGEGLLTALIDTQGHTLNLTLPGDVRIGSGEAEITNAFPEFGTIPMDGTAGFRRNEILYAKNVRSNGSNGYVLIRNNAPYYSALTIICKDGLVTEISFECLGMEQAAWIFE